MEVNADRYELDAGQSVDGSWRGVDTKTGRLVRLVSPHSSWDGDFDRLVGEYVACDHIGLDAVLDVSANQISSRLLVTQCHQDMNLVTMVERAPNATAEIRRTWAEYILHVAQSVAVLHEHNLVHGNLSPEMVQIIDHSSTRLVAVEFVVSAGAALIDLGDPLWISPEQARGEPISPLSNIFSLGAMLFFVMHGRAPLAESDPAESRARRAVGSMDDATLKESIYSQVGLRQLAKNAMSLNPQDRPSTVVNFVLALEQALHPSREFHLENVRQKRSLSLQSITILFLLFVVGFYGYMSWFESGRGTSVVKETFSDAGSWRSNWVVTDGRFDVQNGTLQSLGESVSAVIYKERISAPATIEFTASFAKDMPAGDLSAFWTEEGPDVKKSIYKRSGYLAQTGAYDNAFAGLVRLGESSHLATSRFTLKADQQYRIKFVVANDRLIFSVDGNQLCQWQSTVPFRLGWFGLLGYYQGKSFDDIVIQSQILGDQDPLKVADALFGYGYFEDAAHEYDFVQSRLQDADLQGQALYRLGLAQQRAGHFPEATQAWSQVTAEPWLSLGKLSSSERWLHTQDHAPILAALSEMGQSSDLRIQSAQRWVWTRGMQSGEVELSPSLTNSYINIRSQVLPNDVLTEILVVENLIGQRRFDDALAMSGLDPRATSKALLSAGQFQRVLNEYAGQLQENAMALLFLGRFDEVRNRFGHFPSIRRQLLFNEGDVEGFLKLAISHTNEFDVPRMQYADLLKMISDQSLSMSRRNNAALLYGDLASIHLFDQSDEKQLIQLAVTGQFEELSQLPLLTRQSLIREIVLYFSGTQTEEQLDRLQERILSITCDPTWSEMTLVNLLAVPWVSGGKNGIRNALELGLMNSGDMARTKHLSAFILGQEDEVVFLNQPSRLYAQRVLTLAQAVRADLAESDSEAAMLYGQWLSLRPQERPIHDQLIRDVAIEGFVGMRLAELRVNSESD